MVKCSICGREAFYYRQYSGHNLCPRCLERMILKSVRKRISRLALGRRVTVVVPLYRFDPWGSMVTVRLVSRIEKKFDSKVILVYPEEYAGSILDVDDNIELRRISIPLPKADSLIHCIRYERAWAVREAYRAGATIIVDSLNRDHIVLAALEALMQGRPEGVSEAIPVLTVKEVRIIHALANVEAEAVTALAYSLGYTYLDPSCSAPSIAKKVFNRVSRGRPELLFSSIKVFGNLSRMVSGRKCIVCGGAGGPICQYCRESGAFKLVETS